jgi:hypothetical protein
MTSGSEKVEPTRKLVVCLVASPFIGLSRRSVILPHAPPNGTNCSTAGQLQIENLKNQIGTGGRVNSRWLQAPATI